jgi:hypothetical protein
MVIALVPALLLGVGVVAAAPAGVVAAGFVAAAAVSRVTSPLAVALVALSLLASPLRPLHAPTATSDAHVITVESLCHLIPTI